MKVLISAAGSSLGRVLADGLTEQHQVVLADSGDGLGHDSSTNDLVRGVDVVVHSGASDKEASASHRLDTAMRRTYNLLWAAAEERVPRVVLLSSLGLFGKYDEGRAVTETWRPMPTTDTEVLSHHLAEFVCREFAREGRTSVVCLRLGDLVSDANEPGSTSALYAADAVQAVGRAIVFDLPIGRTTGLPQPWSVFHVQSDVPNARFLTGNAQEALGFVSAKRS
jgi:nucleoside-diphosphate-sugar epimerase